MAIPQPGKKVRGSKTGKPMMAVFDLLGKRWALGVIWQLNDRILTFRDLQSECYSISPGVLNTRIKELREAEIIERTTEGYQLTSRGKELRKALEPLGEWSITWAEEVFDYKYNPQ